VIHSVGLNVLSADEERFHFGMWAINKSPLVIGAALDVARLSKTSLAILSNKEVIAINQDSLAKQAQLARRYSEDQWDMWMGELSGSRKVLGVANWKNDSQSINFDLASLGIAAATARDVWAAKDLGSVSGAQKLNLTGHEMRLWVLSDITAATSLSSKTYYAVAKASLSGSARLTSCPHDTCQPTGLKAGNIGAGAGVTFSSVNAHSAGKKILGIDFINYDYAFTTAWDLGDNIRNMTVTVNGGKAKRWAFPLSGQNWSESGRLMVEVEGFRNGTGNVVTFAAFGNAFAPDLVGFEVLE
jgi:alpha-galactosidase